MFHWYHNAARCYMFLSDVSGPSDNQLAFRLLAPKLVQLFARESTLLGDKLYAETPLPIFDIKERFKWAESRQTTREEDWAYSLLGIFGVFISPIYGEGKENAVRRLRKEISDKLRSEGMSGLHLEVRSC
ncbi:hypothetical protein QBC34DRAFT_469443 [Podospora aff. communis PSN243]|uniref:Uncharacterized protein n=1 Tax=Podospora aff. communis PSN243 TaxID=3040156 RepID=A0AAV9GEF3_9PEZI|nr:hypothetical protein QBC34DRAFT_469443 [Podospora aff. communis PSN243]